MSLRPALVIALAAATIATAAACQGQGEGGLCNPKAGNNGNDDCQSGLTCQIKTAVVMNPYGICCPSGNASTSACSVAPAQLNPAPPDAATGPTATEEAGGDDSAQPAAGDAEQPSDAAEASVE